MSDSMKYVTEPVYDQSMKVTDVIVDEENDLSLGTKALQVPKQEMEEDKQHKGKIFPTNFCIKGIICDLLIEKGSYENMESQEILNKQELKHQHKLSCLNKGDETRVARGCYSILCDEVDIQSCNYDMQVMWITVMWLIMMRIIVMDIIYTSYVVNIRTNTQVMRLIVM